MPATTSNMYAMTNSIQRLAKSYGYTISRDRESVKRINVRTWELLKLVRADGTPGPKVTVRVVDGRLKWERHA